MRPTYKLLALTTLIALPGFAAYAAPPGYTGRTCAAAIQNNSIYTLCEVAINQQHYPATGDKGTSCQVTVTCGMSQGGPQNFDPNQQTLICANGPAPSPPNYNPVPGSCSFHPYTPTSTTTAHAG